MNLDHIHRDLGRVEAKLDATADRVAALESKLDAVLARQYRFAGVASVLSAGASFAAAWLLK